MPQNPTELTQWIAWVSVMLLLPKIGEHLDKYHVSDVQRSRVRNKLAALLMWIDRPLREPDVSDPAKETLVGIADVGAVMVVGVVLVLLWGVFLRFMSGGTSGMSPAVATAATMGVIFIIYLAGSALRLAVVVLHWTTWMLLRAAQWIAVHVLGAAARPEHSPYTYFGSLLTVILALTKAVIELAKAVS